MKLEALPDNFLFQQSLKIFDPQKTEQVSLETIDPHFSKSKSDRIPFQHPCFKKSSQ